MTVKTLKVLILILTMRKNAEPTENRLLGCIKELRPQTDWYSENWRDEQMPMITAYQEHKPITGAGIFGNTVNCTWWIAGGSVPLSSGAEELQSNQIPEGSPYFCEPYLQEPHQVFNGRRGEKSPPASQQREGGKNHFEIDTEHSVPLKKGCLKATDFTRAWLPGGKEMPNSDSGKSWPNTSPRPRPWPTPLQ